MNILIYYQSSFHTVFLESLVQHFVQKGHKVFFLTICEKGLLHEKVEMLGGKTFTYVPRKNKLLLYFLHWWYLIRFCRQHKIQVVYSHLQYVNLIAVLAQYFIKAIVYPCRHHADDVMINGNKNALLTDKLVNKFSKKIIVVSDAVKQQLTQYENTPARKIVVIPLGYNFALYDNPDLTKTIQIREEVPCHLLLIMIGRMYENKRHIVALKLLHALVQEGLDVKMILLDRGEKEQELKDYVRQNNLTDKVLFAGFLNNTINHLAASDLLVHPSVSEASNQVVKEAGYLKKPSVVCRGVGDFEEYIVNGENGFLVSKENTMEEMKEVIKEYYNQKETLQSLGVNMKKVILERFDISKTGQMYLDLAKI